MFTVPCSTAELPRNGACFGGGESITTLNLACKFRSNAKKKTPERLDEGNGLEGIVWIARCFQQDEIGVASFDLDGAPNQEEGRGDNARWRHGSM